MTISQIAAHLALGFAAVFLILLIALHFLEPEFDPSWRWISEYVLGRYGWMMSLAFFSIGGSALAALVTVWPSLPTLGGAIGRWWLLLIAIAFVGAGIFITDPITDMTPSAAGDLHSLFGVIVILTFPIVATLLARGLIRNREWSAARHQLLWTTLLTWVGLLAFLGSIIASSVINHPTGLGPEVLAGWPNRFMIVTYSIWLMVVAWRATLMAKHERPPIAA